MLPEPDLDLLGDRRPPTLTEATVLSVDGTDEQPGSRRCDHRGVYIEQDEHTLNDRPRRWRMVREA
jgi:hypothetical protein